MKYWVNTASLEHVIAGRAEGVIQAAHGKKGPLERLSSGDRVVFYSPRISLGGRALLQQFTAVAEIIDDQIYQINLTPHFAPFQRRARYLEARPCEIRPLIGRLDFIPDKSLWGYVFRVGMFEIAPHDYRTIADCMGVHE